jgi:hypothetical protein
LLGSTQAFGFNYVWNACDFKTGKEIGTDSGGDPAYFVCTDKNNRPSALIEIMTYDYPYSPTADCGPGKNQVKAADKLCKKFQGTLAENPSPIERNGRDGTKYGFDFESLEEFLEVSTGSKEFLDSIINLEKTPRRVGIDYYGKYRYPRPDHKHAENGNFGYEENKLVEERYTK